MAYLYLICAFTFNSVANILLKIGAGKGLVLSGSLATLITANWQTLLGLVLFASNILFYFLALRSFPISAAYPVMVMMSFIIINGYAFLVLGEAITPLQILGYLLIVVGVMLVMLNIR